MTRAGVKKACDTLTRSGFLSKVIRDCKGKDEYLYFGRKAHSDWGHKIFWISMLKNDSTVFSVRVKDAGSKKESTTNLRFCDFRTMKDFAEYFYSFIAENGCYVFNTNAGL